MRLRLALVLVLVGGLGGSASAQIVPQTKWLQVRSPHFTVMGEVGAGDLRRVAERMEQLHELLRIVTGSTDIDVRDVTVVVFKDRRSFEPYQPRYQGSAVAVGGYFQPGPMNFITILGDSRDDYADTVYHEYVHLATRRMYGPLPSWMSEGFAEFFSTFDASGGRTVVVGDAIVHHIRTLRQQMLPLAALASVDRDSPFYNERDKSSVFYAQSWALTHYLRIGQREKYLPKLSGFYGALAAGAAFDRAVSEHLGTTVAELEKELRQHLDGVTFQRLVIKLPEALSRVERLAASPVAEAEAHTVLAQLLLAQEDREQARAHLEHGLKADAGQPLTLALLAHMEAEATKREEAAAMVERSASAAGGTYLSAYYRARALEDIGGDTEPALRQLEAAWRAVLADNPYSDEASSRLAQLRADQPDGLAEARVLQQQAIRLAPGREDYLLGLGRILLLEKDTTAARAVLGSLVAHAKHPEVRRVARQYLAIAAKIELAKREPDPVVDKPPPEIDIPDVPATGGTAPPPSPPPTFEPVLRNVLEGEARVFATLTAIECSGEGSVVAATTASGPLRVRGETLDRVDFVSFRSDIAGAIACGPQRQELPVLVTYRPDPEGDTAGEVVIVEVVPVGYRPKP